MIFTEGDRVSVLNWGIDEGDVVSKYSGREGTVKHLYPRVNAYLVILDDDPDGGGFFFEGLICYENELEFA